MSRIEGVFAKLKDEGRTALITFIMAGDPGHDTSLAILNALPGAGADIIELGMPFTDPVADGPTIQAAGLRALAAGASMEHTLQMVRSFRNLNGSTPIVLMGYANPLMAWGWEKFAKDAAAAGVDGLIIVDLPPEEDKDFRALCSQSGLDLIRLLTPTSDAERLPTLLEGVSGFLYYVSIAGITGSGSASADTIAPHIAMIKSASSLPLAVGFGIKTPGDAKAMAAAGGDAIVVGSALIADIEANPAQAAQRIADKVQALKAALA
jgi:tryptophan synthase alpha chain